MMSQVIYRGFQILLHKVKPRSLRLKITKVCYIKCIPKMLFYKEIQDVKVLLFTLLPPQIFFFAQANCIFFAENTSQSIF